MNMFEPSRNAALAALDRFVPNAGRHYAEHRNFDYGPQRRDNISALSPYIRHRIISEQEVVAAVLKVRSAAAAEKFIQEVFWRTYWKGWLQQRPAVWDQYLAELEHQKSRKIYGLATALNGETDIACFDFWVNELRTTGYLHNHARMWFASIWIFTLRLPWQLGADFFLTHLLDGDPASNTLSWRWVAGLQTIGKHYVADEGNIRRYTDGRFAPTGLAVAPEPLVAWPHAAPEPIPALKPLPPRPFVLLVTEEDMYPHFALPKGVQISGVATVDPVQPCAPNVAMFKRIALQNAAKDVSAHLGVAAKTIEGWNAHELAQWAKDCGVTDLVTTEAPAGFVAPKLERLAQDLAAVGVKLRLVRRQWDDLCWPHARKGFFAFKEKIPAFIRDMDLA
jgi:deoxyribodipyrimidine photo-lyase